MATIAGACQTSSFFLYLLFVMFVFITEARHPVLLNNGNKSGNFL